MGSEFHWSAGMEPDSEVHGWSIAEAVSSVVQESGVAPEVEQVVRDYWHVYRSLPELPLGAEKEMLAFTLLNLAYSRERGARELEKEVVVDAGES